MSKYLLLIVFILLLSGCGWEDVAKEYGDILKTNPTCSYKDATGRLDGAVGFSSVKFSADMNGIYVVYNGTSKFDLVKDGRQHYLNDKLINYNDFDVKRFFDSYKSYGCLSTIYVCVDTTTISVTDVNTKGDACYAYSKTSGTSPGGVTQGGTVQSSGKPCANTNAISCEQTFKVDQRKNTVSVEIGKEKKQNGSENNYFIVSYDNFKTAPIIRNNDTYMATNGDVFVVSDSVFELKDGKYNKDIPWKYSLEGTTGYYYLGDHEDKVGVDIGSSGVVNPNENVGDQTNVNGNEIVDINICEDGNILKGIRVVGFVFFVLKILVPLILIVMATVDFAKAVISSDDKSNKDAINKLVRRTIIAVIIFLIPTVLDFAFSFVDRAVNTMRSFDACSTCLFDPLNCDISE